MARHRCHGAVPGGFRPGCRNRLPAPVAISGRRVRVSPVLRGVWERPADRRFHSLRVLAPQPQRHCLFPGGLLLLAQTKENLGKQEMGLRVLRVDFDRLMAACSYCLRPM